MNFVTGSINLLGYTLLEMIAREASSGYDLAYRLKIMQNTHHSQIYPMLAKLEENGYLVSTTQFQERKPNKKIYAITIEGIELLREWSKTAIRVPVSRDEFIIKLQLDWLNPKRTNELLKERIRYLEEQLQETEKTLVAIQETLGLASSDEKQSNMPYQIYQRKYQLTLTEKNWCLSLLDK